jgi:hypothetical protein
MLKRLSSLVIYLTLITTFNAFADQLKIGDSLPDNEFLDQHGQSHRLDSTIQLLIFAHTKDTGSMMTDILADAVPDHLLKQKAVYIADISGMPSLIARIFALPKMRKIGSPIYLVREEDQADWMPKQVDRLTLVTLSESHVRDISYIDSEETIRSMLGLQKQQPAK